jgi:hypothetical protein
MEQQRRLQHDINSYTDRNKETQRRVNAKKRETRKLPDKMDSSTDLMELDDGALSLLTPGSTVRRPSLLLIENSEAEAMLDSPVAKDVFRAPAISPIMTSTPPGELILSPQYSSSVKAKKIFTVSKVDIQSLLSPPGPAPTSISVLSPASLLCTNSSLSQGEPIPSQITPSTLQTILANPILCSPLESVPTPMETSSSNPNLEDDITDFIRNLVINVADNAWSACDQCQQNNSGEETSGTTVHTNTTNTDTNPINRSTNASVPKPVRDLKLDRDSGFGSCENEQWTQIESSEIPSSVMNGHANFSETLENPNFQSSLTMNGLTEELASVLESIEHKTEAG